jgi:hypothetical protein
MKHFHDEILITCSHSSDTQENIREKANRMATYLNKYHSHLDHSLLPQINESSLISQAIQVSDTRFKGSIKLTTRLNDPSSLHIGIDAGYRDERLSKSLISLILIGIVFGLGLASNSMFPSYFSLIISISAIMTCVIIVKYIREMYQLNLALRTFEIFYNKSVGTIRNSFIRQPNAKEQNPQAIDLTKVLIQIEDESKATKIEKVIRDYTHHDYESVVKTLNSIDIPSEVHKELKLIEAESFFELEEFLNSFCIYKELLSSNAIDISNHPKFQQSALMFYNQTMDDSLLNEFLQLRKNENSLSSVLSEA